MKTLRELLNEQPGIHWTNKGEILRGSDWLEDLEEQLDQPAAYVDGKITMLNTEDKS